MTESDFVKFDCREYSPKRELSSFIGNQLLAEYALGKLDPISVRVIEEKIKGDDHLATSLRALQHSIDYCKSLGNIQVSNDIFIDIEDPNDFAPRWHQWLNWKKWPTSFRWSSEALAISILVAIIASLIPWKRLLYQLTLDRQWTVAEINRDSSQELKTEIRLSDPVQSPGHQEAVSNVDEELTPKTPVVPETTPGTPAQTAKPESTTTTDDVDKSTEKPETNARPVSPQKGFVYRATMKLKNLDSVSSKIVTLIENLGGVKAGEVRLGWRKPDGSYFHFLISENQYEELKRQLFVYAPVQITKEEHPRVIEAGKMRIILWVEELIEPGTAPSESQQNPPSNTEVKPDDPPPPPVETSP